MLSQRELAWQSNDPYLMRSESAACCTVDHKAMRASASPCLLLQEIMDMKEKGEVCLVAFPALVMSWAWKEAGSQSSLQAKPPDLFLALLCWQHFLPMLQSTPKSEEHSW